VRSNKSFIYSLNQQYLKNSLFFSPLPLSFVFVILGPFRWLVGISSHVINIYNSWKEREKEKKKKNKRV
jgi:hypothetical protein